jgi:hypothetical protein
MFASGLSCLAKETSNPKESSRRSSIENDTNEYFISEKRDVIFIDRIMRNERYEAYPNTKY